MAPKFQDILVTVKDGLRIIKFNRPRKYNAITSQMYIDLATALKDAAADDNTKITALTGAGDYYCSGNDLSNFNADMGSDLDAALKKASASLYDFVDAFISFPKLLVAVVNGPAIGISVTTLALCDIAFASDKASEVLYLNRKLTAAEALKCGLVSRVSTNLEVDVWPMLRTMAAELNTIALGHAKTIVRGWDIDMMRKANAAECKRLEERWGSEDCMQSVLAFLTRKSKM